MDVALARHPRIRENDERKAAHPSTSPAYRAGRRDAQQAGLLSPKRLEQWLRDQLQALRGDELFAAIDRMTQVAEPEPMSPEEIAEEIAVMRAERRNRNAQ
jgi:hypothetical protein